MLNLSQFYPVNIATGLFVYTINNQTISGQKVFNEKITAPEISAEGSPGFLRRINLDSGYIYGGDTISLDYFNRILSGSWVFENRPTINGTGVLLQNEIPGNLINILYATGNQTVNGVKNFTIRPTVNNTGVLLSGEISPGIYNYDLEVKTHDSYTKQSLVINANFINGIKNKDIINFYFETGNDSPEPFKSRTLKVNPGILIDVENAKLNSRNLIKFNNDTPYSGKAIRKIRYNSTIGNGYETFVLAPQASGLNKCPIIKPKTRRLETFYEINVPSGSGIVRFINFQKPTSFPFVQGLVMNLKFNFEADNTPCIVSGIFTEGTSIYPVFTLTGANYNFSQKQRVILVHKYSSQGIGYEFKLW